MKRLLAALCGLFLLPLTFAQGGRVNDIAIGADGRPAGGATVKVCTSAASPGDGSTSSTACSPAASIYSDRTLTTLDADSIIAADSSGNYKYYAQPGFYIEQVCKAGACISRLVNSWSFAMPSISTGLTPPPSWMRR
jgi:hypothetical protein